MQEYGWKMDEQRMNEHDKDDGIQDIYNMSRSNIWKNYGSMYDNGWTWKVHVDG